MDYPRSLAELGTMFPDDEACARHLARLRFPGGFSCTRCGLVDEPWVTTRGRLVCRGCRFETRLTAGTVLEKTRTPLTTWFAAAWLVATAKNGMSAKTLERTLGVSYRTAWAMLHRFRVAMVRSERPKLHGRVEVDETFVGGVRHGMGRGPVGKLAVAVAVEVYEPKGFGRCRLRHIPAPPRQEFVVPFVVDTVEPGALLLTDGARLYDPLTSRGYGRQAVSMATAAGPAHEYLPGVHRVASLLKRWLLGTHQGSVDPAHLQAYLEEFTFRWNRRNATHRGLVFHRLIEQAVATEPVTVDGLTWGYYTAPPPEPIGAGSRRVVLLEGPPVSAALLRRHLQDDGRFCVIYAGDDPHLTAVAASRAQPDVIVVAAIHGLDAAAKLAAACPSAAVIVNDDHSRLSPADIAGSALPVVTGPYQYDQLADRIAALSHDPPHVPF